MTKPLVKVTPKRNYDHPLNETQHVAYLAGVTVEVTEEVRDAMRAAGALKTAEPEPDPPAA